MPSYAPNFTPRFKFGYRVAGVDHHLQLRGVRGASASSMVSTALTVAYDCFNLFVSSLADDFLWTEAEACDEDSEAFFPIANPAAVTGTVDFSAWSAVKRITGLSISGKAPLARARLTLFGLNLNSDTDTSAGADGLLLSSESGPLITLKASLDSFACAGSGVQAIWRSRGTIKVNDRLLKLVRRGLIA